MGEPVDPELTELAPASDTPTRSDRAWALDDGDDDAVTTRLTPGRITAGAVTASLMLICIAVAVGVWLLPGDNQAEDAASVPTTERPVAPPDDPAEMFTDPADRSFVEELRIRNVEVSDPVWYIQNARFLCGVMVRDDVVPGARAMESARKFIAGEDPTWDSAKVGNFAEATINAYCPQMRGLGSEAIAALPPDQRFIALFEQRTGMRSMDHAGNIEAARNQCAELSAGTSRESLAKEIMTPTINEDTAQRVIDVSIEVYCPEVR